MPGYMTAAIWSAQTFPKCSETDFHMPRTKLKPPYLFDARSFRRRIGATLAARDVSLRAAADEIRCDYSALSRIFNGRMKPNTEVYLRIQAWLAKQAPSPERATKVRPDK